jgi:predicted ATP-binding protein involved in virulence
MNLQSITIEKLFGQFDYNIVFNQDAGITILTGPNGYGKTTILNIIYGIFNKGTYLDDLRFKKISISFKDGSDYIAEKNKEFGAMREAGYPVKTQAVYFVKDQRLKQTGTELGKESVNINVIEHYAKELSVLIAKKSMEQQKYLIDLEREESDRFFDYKNVMPESEFENRYQQLIAKQRKLQEYGIYPSTLKKGEYSVENRKYLSFQIEEHEKKTGFYDDLLARLNLFVELLTRKEFANKKIHISPEQGYYFTTSDEQSLKLTDLSSGEQQQIILLYELLFKAEPGSLVLIDEPETSLHVVWQQLFLSDLQKIAALKQLSFFVATHSPDIMDDKWDLSIDLYALTHKEDDNAE